MVPSVVVYTDGSYLKKSNTGGWSAHISMDNGKTILISGGVPDTTNQRMELTAILNALKAIKIKSNITIYSDSDYSIKCLTKWYKSWEKNNWVTSGFGGRKPQPVKNSDLIKDTLESIRCHKKVRFIWVKAHTGGEDNINELVDTEARREAMAIA